MKVTGILLAAGASRRMGRDKLIISLGGRTVLRRSAEALLNGGVTDIIISVSDATRQEAEALCAQYGLRTVNGGETRGDSVYNALKAADCDIALIHDGARCLVSEEIIRDSIRCAAEFGSGVAAIPARDTMWREGELVDRNGVMLAQTPQSFKYDRIMKAYRQSKDDGVQATDDCALYKRLYGSVHYSLGGVINQKLTTEEDIELFQKVTARERIGYGEDTHRLTEGRRLVIGGVEIPYRMGLMGHSDADVLIHAVIDALLGAAAMGDIGRLFPDSSPEYKDMDSLILLKRAWQMVRGAGYEICSVDATVIAQEPKLAPYIDNMRRNIADAMGCDVGIVSAKATTPEHTGPEGNLECITARSVCMIRG